jgi:hypothetical protein
VCDDEDAEIIDLPPPDYIVQFIFTHKLEKDNDNEGVNLKGSEGGKTSKDIPIAPQGYHYEYRVKFKDLSYLHLKWVTAAQFMSEGQGGILMFCVVGCLVDVLMSCVRLNIHISFLLIFLPLTFSPSHPHTLSLSHPYSLTLPFLFPPTPTHPLSHPKRETKTGAILEKNTTRRRMA